LELGWCREVNVGGQVREEESLGQKGVCKKYVFKKSGRPQCYGQHSDVTQKQNTKLAYIYGTMRRRYREQGMCMMEMLGKAVKGFCSLQWVVVGLIFSWWLLECICLKGLHIVGSMHVILMGWWHDNMLGVMTCHDKAGARRPRRGGNQSTKGGVCR
jgi:hypothetical protein